MEKETLKPHKLQAVYMLLAGETHAFIAKVVGVTPRTIRRWMEQPKFSACLKREYDSLANIIRTHHRVQTLKSGEMSLEATRFLHHVMTAEGSSLPARMRAAGQLMNYSFKQMVHAQKWDKEEWATPIKGLREKNVEHQVKSEIKEAGQTVPKAKAPKRSKPAQPVTAQSVVAPAPQPDLPAQLATVSTEDFIHFLVKADSTGQRRTSEAEHLARRERIRRLEERLEAPATDQLPEVSQAKVA